MTAMNMVTIKKRGFTIVELLVVIVVIGILAAITIVSYSGIANRAVVASVASDLDNASKQLRLYQTLYDSYPTAMTNNCPTAPVNDPTYCLKSSSGTTLVYSSVAPKTFHLTETKDNVSYSINDSTTPKVATNDSSSSVGFVCPTGFIPVPGSGTYGTNDFCIMKYEAKADDNGDGVGDTSQTTGSNTWPADTYPISSSRKLVSSAAGYPVTKISQTTALSVASTPADVYGCTAKTSCHLITEAEWMTLAQNVLSVKENWSGGAVGSGYIFSGHSDSSPNTALVADTSDSNGYAGTGNSSGEATLTNGIAGNAQKRTLTLTNGQVIWDLAGNIWESTSGTIDGGKQPGFAGETAYSGKQWSNASLLRNGFPETAMPSSTGLTGAVTWGTLQGIGQLYSNYGETEQTTYIRGGVWTGGATAGVLRLQLYLYPEDQAVNLGLRVAAFPE